MRYQHSTMIGAALFVMAAATSVGAQMPAGPGMLGFYDPATGAFQPLTVQPQPSAASAVEPRAKVSRAGKIRFNLKIKVLSGSPEATLPSCSINVSHSGVLVSYNESLSLQGTRTGNNARCQGEISYSWPDANNANPVNVSFFVSVTPRSHSEGVPPFGLPGNNATTDLVIDIVS